MPKYTVTIPSLKEEVRIRPFVVKEEKILLIAMESQDPKQIAGAILDTVVSCVEDPIDANKLTSYDVEYLFLQIRGKSVGEKTNVSLKCQECDAETEVEIDINDVKIDGEILPKQIKMTDDISLEMRQPSYNDIAADEMVVGQGTNMDRIFALIIQSINAVLTEDERIEFRSIPHKEAVEFIESMTSEQFTQIREYMEKMPSLRHVAKWTCDGCGKPQELTLEGMQSFF